MGVKKPCVLIICILLTAVITCGCWNYLDVDDLFVITGASVAKDPKTDEYILTAEISKAKGAPQTELITRIESATGTTLFEASRNGINKVAAKLYWGHAMVFIISESIAREGIVQALSMLSRQTQIRSDMLIIVCEDASIGKVFEFEDPIHDDVSEHLHDLFESYEASGKFVKPPLYKVFQELASSEISLILPYIRMIDTQEDQDGQNGSQTGQGKNGDNAGSSENAEDKIAKNVIVVDGSAVFRGEKMVGRLDETATRSTLILKNELEKNFVLTIEEKGILPNCSMEVISSDIKITPSVKENEQLAVQIDLEIEGDIVEMQTAIDYLTEASKKILEQEFEEITRQQLMAAVGKAQKVCGADIFGFAAKTHHRIPGFWKKNSSDWDRVFRNAEVSVRVDVTISSSSLSMNPVKVDE